MKVALVHDYIKEYGGAERVLEALCELYPDAPIYTAFYMRDSMAYQKFKNPSTSSGQARKIIPSWVHYIPFFATKLHSPLRFLAPLIWGSFDFSEYDVVISSASWYVTKGVIKRPKTKDQRPVEICYCHTPPRWLYGYKTSVEWQKYWPIKVYAAIVGHFMRMYDFKAAQRVDYFIANSIEVQNRIKKFYRRDATVIYPPVLLDSRQSHITGDARGDSSKNQLKTRSLSERLFSHADKKGSLDVTAFSSPASELPPSSDYYLIVARLVGAKGLELAIEAAIQKGFHLKIVGAASGYYTKYKELSEKAQNQVEFLGFVQDEELVHLYANAKAFLALATDEDFGITPVEAMLCGTPVIAYNGGGYKETVVDGKTGVLFSDLSVDGLKKAMEQLNNITISSQDCKKQAEKFSKERFKQQINEFVEKVTK